MSLASTAHAAYADSLIEPSTLRQPELLEAFYVRCSHRALRKVVSSILPSYHPPEFSFTSSSSNSVTLSPSTSHCDLNDHTTSYFRPFMRPLLKRTGRMIQSMTLSPFCFKTWSLCACAYGETICAILTPPSFSLPTLPYKLKSLTLYGLLCFADILISHCMMMHCRLPALTVSVSWTQKEIMPSTARLVTE